VRPCPRPHTPQASRPPSPSTRAAHHHQTAYRPTISTSQAARASPLARNSGRLARVGSLLAGARRADISSSRSLMLSMASSSSSSSSQHGSSQDTVSSTSPPKRTTTALQTSRSRRRKALSRLPQGAPSNPNKGRTTPTNNKPNAAQATQALPLLLPNSEKASP
jgi:hypothetical protein